MYLERQKYENDSQKVEWMEQEGEEEQEAKLRRCDGAKQKMQMSLPSLLFT